MMILEKGNLVTGNYDIFCHQVNCKGVMGSGIAKQIKDKYPEVYRAYRNKLAYHSDMLGYNLYARTEDGRICVNMFAQEGFGRLKVHTNYEAFQNCLNLMKEWLKGMPEDKVVGFPYKIGCGLGGGDWHIIYDMLVIFSKQVKQKVVIVSLE